LTVALPRKRADELFESAFATRWARREQLDVETRAVHRAVLRLLLAGAGPIGGAAITAESGLGPDAVEAALSQLDAADFLLVSEGRVRLAYPLSAEPTGFAVTFAGGRSCHACCAIDALGLPAMAGEAVTVRASCHHCGEALSLRVGPDGPADSPDVMVWVGERGDLRGRARDVL
jgi:hypothetical protein